MKVLHLFSNAKWTGPAEPALNLCLALRAMGVEAEFACAPDAGASINRIVETARDRGIEPVLDFHLRKHRHPLWNGLDRRTLAKRIAANGYDLLHCHLDNDHRIAAPVAKRLGLPLVRSSYYGEGIPRHKGLPKLAQSAAAIAEPSERAAVADRARLGLRETQTPVIPAGIDTERFDPSREVPGMRRWLQLPPEAFVIGIVARMQTHRRFEDLFEALRLLVDSPDLKRPVHLVAVGRGTKQDSVAFQPVRDLGLEDRVHFPGYVDGENYVGMLKAFDAKVFLMPGSDGTCRAVREAMAMAKPCVAADRGMLSELVESGKTGYLCDGSPQELALALHRLAADRAHAYALGQAARQTALERFALPVQAQAVAVLYERVTAAD